MPEAKRQASRTTRGPPRYFMSDTNAIESLNAATDGRSRPAGASAPSNRAKGSTCPLPGPDRAWQSTMVDGLEAGVERVLDHLREPLPGR
jgi:hypothetical protein